jgi:regulator of sigma E protease
MQFGSVLFAGLGIGLLIFIHELGHFLAARLAGVRVEIFSLGFGPRLCGFHWQGTDFRLSLVPFGGFVMVAGQDPTDRRYPARESLYGKSIGQRMLFWSGGVLMNVLFALVVFPLAFRAGVPVLAPVIGSVQKGGAAWEGDLQPGDRVLGVQGKKVFAFENLSTEIALHGQKPLQLEVQTAEEAPRTVTLTPHFNTNDRVYELGIAPSLKVASLRVLDGGPAAAAGLRTGDEVRSVNGVLAKGTAIDAALTPLVEPDGKPVSIEVFRDGATIAATVTPQSATEPSPGRIGVEHMPRRVVGIRPGSRLVQGLGIRRGDVILAIDDKPFLGGSLEVANTGPERLRIHLLRDGQLIIADQAASATERFEFAAHVALTVDVLMLLPMSGGAALAAGMQPGDRIESVDGEEVTDIPGLRKFVERTDAAPLKVRVRRLPPDTKVFYDPIQRDLPLGDLVELTIQPRHAPAVTLGLVAEVQRLEEEVRAASFGEALRLGTTCSLDLVKQFLVTLKRLATGEVGAKNLGGIIRISQVSYHAAQRGMTWFWYFLALLSVNLAFVNLLPVPVLDGGHLLFLFIEKVKGSPVSTKVLGYSQVVGLVFVLLLVLFVTYNDILRLF